MLKFPDNTVRILVEGLHRFRIAGYASTEPYLCARVDVLPDVEEETLELKAVARKAQNQFKEIMNLSPAISEQVKVSVLNAENSAALSAYGPPPNFDRPRLDVEVLSWFRNGGLPTTASN